MSNSEQPDKAAARASEIDEIVQLIVPSIDLAKKLGSDGWCVDIKALTKAAARLVIMKDEFLIESFMKKNEK